VELHQIRYFLALARSLNFTRAAQVCNVTQPALTKAVQKLELELGGVLIHRERQLTQLTDLGKLVLPMLERAFVAAESVHTLAIEFQRKEIAPLKIALAPCVSAGLFEAPLAEIARFMPGLQVELVEAEPERLNDLLLDGTVNAAVGSDEAGELPVRIDHWTLVEEHYRVLVPRDSSLATMAEVSIDLLKDETWLERADCDAFNQIWRGLFPPDYEPHIGHRGRHLGHLQHMVAAGLGLMLWPEHAPHLPGLVTRPFREGSAPTRNLQLLVVAGRRYSPALEALVKIARLHDWRAGFPKPDAAVMAPADGRDRRTAPASDARMASV
jgi:DNA-binding transcriptional LysR family regulator